MSDMRPTFQPRQLHWRPLQGQSHSVVSSLSNSLLYFWEWARTRNHSNISQVYIIDTFVTAQLAYFPPEPFWFQQYCAMYHCVRMPWKPCTNFPETTLYPGMVPFCAPIQGQPQRFCHSVKYLWEPPLILTLNTFTHTRPVLKIRRLPPNDN